MPTQTNTFTLEEFNSYLQEFAGMAAGFVDSFNGGYQEAYQAAVARGDSVFQARLAGLENAVANSTYYANLNASRTASRGDSALAQTYQNLSSYYSSISAGLSSQVISTQGELDAFVGSMRAQAAADLGHFGSSAVGRGLAEFLGPAYDAAQMLDAATEQDWDALGGAGTSLLFAEGFAALGLIAAAAFGVTAGIPVAIIVGLFGVAGGLLGSALWDEWSSSLIDRMEFLFSSILDDTYRIQRYDPLVLISTQN